MPSTCGLALEAGKHVLCEKPVGEGREEAEPLYRLAAERSLLLLAAPFVQLNPTYRALWTAVADGAIGRPHSARALYGTAGATWAAWFHDGSVGPLAELGHLQPEEPHGLARACRGDPGRGEHGRAAAGGRRRAARRPRPRRAARDPPARGRRALVASSRGRRSSATAGPHSRSTAPRARPTCSATTGIRPATSCGATARRSGSRTTRSTRRGCGATACASSWPVLREGRAPLASSSHDLHLLDVIAAARVASRERRAVAVGSGFDALDLRVAAARRAAPSARPHAPARRAVAEVEAAWRRV